MLLSMKLNRSSDDANERIRVVELGLNDANTEIEVKQVIMEKDVKTLGNVFKFVQCLMGEKECRYIVYDCHYETPQTKKEDLIFIMWSCDHASPKSRMVYSSSKSALHGKDETTPQSFCGKMGKEKVLKLEGLDVKES
uniref:ADF-H domain-containing protein n=1 Tax=Periophthalmus magnuspinnatus TaxID=409849 RepID=A0A3B4B8L3_9GOBI